MNKRGQFYLLAAIIIIALAVGLLLVTNYSKKQDNSKVNNLAEELQIESGKILDYGAHNGTYNWYQFTKNFSDYSGKDVNTIFILGKLISGGITNQDVFFYNLSGQKETYTNTNLTGTTLKVSLYNYSYSFQFKQGENFYFIMYQNIGGERYVVTNQ